MSEPEDASISPVPFPAIVVCWAEEGLSQFNVKLVGVSELLTVSLPEGGWFAVRMCHTPRDLDHFLISQQERSEDAAAEDTPAA